MDTNQCIIKRISRTVECLAARSQCFCHPTNFKEARFPGWEYIVDDEGYMGVLEDIAILFGLTHRAPTDVDRVQVGIVAKTHRRVLGMALGVDCRQSPQSLIRQELEFLGCEVAH